MIVFSGMISDEIQSKTMKKRDRHSFLVCAIGSGALIIVSGIIFFVFKEDLKGWLILSGLLIGVVLLLPLSFQKNLGFHWEYSITIDEEKILVESPLWTEPLLKPLKKIKKVLDEGDCYYLIYADINNCIICQKNLIKEGTIEEFEKLFQGKIVKSQKIGHAKRGE